MKLWPWGKQPEQRSYTEARDELAYLQAAGADVASLEQTGLYAAIGGLFARAFATAEVVGANVPSTLLGSIGRALILDGAVVLDINDGLNLRVPDSWLITGEDDPDTWVYKMQFMGPSRQRTVTRPGAGVAHLTLETHPARPWQGISPLRKAAATGKAFAELEQHFVRESQMAHGVLMVMPVAQGELAGAHNQIATGKGKLTMFASAQRADQHQPQPIRYGSQVPDSIIELYRSLGRELCAACGVHPSLLGWNDFASGLDSRETYRQFLSGTIRPIGDRVQAELSAKLETDVRLSWQAMLQSDVAARARAAGTLVEKVGLSGDDAMTTVGLT